MRTWLLAGLVLCALPAWAQSGTPAPDEPVAQSVWQMNAAGTAVHRQSHWQCPLRFGDFARHDVHIFDAFGLDVSCDYRWANGTEITLYLTRRSGGDLAADFEAAKQAMTDRKDNAGVKPVADVLMPTLPTTRTWLQAVYANTSGKMRTGVWYAWYGDWEFEIRATYRTNEEPAVMTAMGQMADEAAKTAEAHLLRCQHAGIPARAGQPITTKDKIFGSVVTFGALLGMDRKRGTDDAGTGKDLLGLWHPADWCVDGSVGDTDMPMLMWHGIDAQGAAMPVDRLELMTLGPPPILESRLDPVQPQLNGEPAAADTYAVLMQQDTAFVLYAFYAGRPEPKRLADTLRAIAKETASPLAKIDPATNTTSLYLEPDEKK